MSRIDWLLHPRETSGRDRKHLRGWDRGALTFIGANRVRLAVLVTLVIAGVMLWRLVASWGWLSTDSWHWLRAESGGMESGSTTIRNLGLVFAGAVALLLAIWRSWVAQRQADTAQQDLLNERYQRGAEMLGSKVFSVRLAGIYALRRLATECPEQYHIQVVQLLCSFARHPPRDKDVEISWVPDELEFRGLRTDVQEVMTAISSCHRKHAELEVAASFELDLKGAELSGLQLANANLSGADLAGSDLSDAQLHSADLSGVKCWDTNLSDANLRCANLSGASIGRTDFSDTRLRGTKLSGAEFHADSPALLATNPTQRQLDQAQADTEKPPIIGPLRDPETGEKLVWRGKTLDGQT